LHISFNSNFSDLWETKKSSKTKENRRFPREKLHQQFARAMIFFAAFYINLSINAQI
jgi:hypothetical protein